MMRGQADQRQETVVTKGKEVIKTVGVIIDIIIGMKGLDLGLGREIIEIVVEIVGIDIVMTEADEEGQEAMKDAKGMRADVTKGKGITEVEGLLHPHHPVLLQTQEPVTILHLLVGLLLPNPQIGTIIIGIAPVRGTIEGPSREGADH